MAIIIIGATAIGLVGWYFLFKHPFKRLQEPRRANGGLAARREDEWDEGRNEPTYTVPDDRDLNPGYWAAQDCKIAKERVAKLTAMRSQATMVHPDWIDRQPEIRKAIARQEAANSVQDLIDDANANVNLLPGLHEELHSGYGVARRFTPARIRMPLAQHNRIDLQGEEAMKALLELVSSVVDRRNPIRERHAIARQELSQATIIVNKFHQMPNLTVNDATALNRGENLMKTLTDEINSTGNHLQLLDQQLDTVLDRAAEMDLTAQEHKRVHDAAR